MGPIGGYSLNSGVGLAGRSAGESDMAESSSIHSCSRNELSGGKGISPSCPMWFLIAISRVMILTRAAGKRFTKYSK